MIYHNDDFQVLAKYSSMQKKLQNLENFIRINNNDAN